MCEDEKSECRKIQMHQTICENLNGLYHKKILITQIRFRSLSENTVWLCRA